MSQSMNLTTSMLEGLTTQDVFDIAAWQILNQGDRAISGAMCSYRAPFGYRCAVGWLIPDAEYRAEFEGKRAAILPMIAEMHGCSPTFVAFLREHERLLSLLQKVHDNHAPFMWWGLLRDVAHAYSLDASVVDHMREKLAERNERARAEAARLNPRRETLCIGGISFEVDHSMSIEPFIMPVSVRMSSKPQPAMSVADVVALVTGSIAETMHIHPALLTNGSPGHVVKQPQEARETAPA
jgi:hypothetical protein